MEGGGVRETTNDLDAPHVLLCEPRSKFPSSGSGTVQGGVAFQQKQTNNRNNSDL